MWKHLEPGSSPVDWCEGNYLISPVIAEFVNTLSNIIFFLLPPLLIHLFKEYGKFVNPGIHIIWALMIVVGLSSAYFHATLSLIGQLLDELAILWVFMAAFSMFYPRRHFPYVFQNNRKLFSVATLIFSIVGTGFAIMHPAVNAFALMTLGIPACYLLVDGLKRCRCGRVFRLGVRSASMWFIAVFCWLSDRLFCDAWSAINFPYLHALWHIFIFIAAYTALVLFAYFAVKDECPEQTPVLKYWPKDNFELGIPYVTIRSYYKDCSSIQMIDVLDNQCLDEQHSTVNPSVSFRDGTAIFGKISPSSEELIHFLTHFVPEPLRDHPLQGVPKERNHPNK